MKNRIDLTVEPRQTGKGNSRELRVNRQVPAVIYGAVSPINVTVGEKEIVKYNTRAYENALFNLKSSEKNANGIVVLVKSVDVHPLSRRPQHVDFYALDLKKAVRVWVEVKLEGKPIGLSEGGLLNVVNRQVEVEVLPTDIPEFITADISGLALGDALHVSDLKVASTVKVISGGELTIAVVSAQDEEVAATPAAAAPAAAPAAGAKAPAAAAGAKAPAAAKPAAKK
ncbi:50S ribosomal protein L25 [Bdellovibrio svalbardensis]|uniref:Large ribosomal subunit protein bL25 n=1 Tax=Bdellovibrio svalbardensis TaxID=2972972 RepID=A0ABT6DLB3_9BACT|nr:50S ribosomal protein L25 [Bdellovibrio svalbardensis]MDG0815913.1 50S ribosomal protein L25 [Bdellovibrio svalbardensis]